VAEPTQTRKRRKTAARTPVLLGILLRSQTERVGAAPTWEKGKKKGGVPLIYLMPEEGERPEKKILKEKALSSNL